MLAAVCLLRLGDSNSMNRRDKLLKCRNYRQLSALCRRHVMSVRCPIGKVVKTISLPQRSDARGLCSGDEAGAVMSLHQFGAAHFRYARMWCQKREKY